MKRYRPAPYSLYQILFPDGKRYIGISMCVPERWENHRSQARLGDQAPLYRAIRKHDDAAKFEVLVIGSKPYIRELEIKTIALYKTKDPAFGYNRHKGGNGSPVEGIGHSPESRAKMSASQKRRVRRPEELARMGVMARQKQMTPEYREKLRQAALRRFADLDERSRVSAILKMTYNPKGLTAWNNRCR